MLPNYMKLNHSKNHHIKKIYFYTKLMSNYKNQYANKCLGEDYKVAITYLKVSGIHAKFRKYRIILTLF